MELGGVHVVVEQVTAMGGHTVESRLDALQRGAAVLGAAVATDEQHILVLAVTGHGIALAQALVDQLAQLRVIQAQHRGGLKLVSVAIHGVVQDAGILQLIQICAILWWEKIVHVLFELVRVAARAGSFFLPGHKPISLERKAASLLVNFSLRSEGAIL